MTSERHDPPSRAPIDRPAEAGFTDVERRLVAGGKSLVTARKA